VRKGDHDFGDFILTNKTNNLPLIDKGVFGAMLFCLRLILARANNPYMTIWLDINQLQTFYLLNLRIQNSFSNPSFCYYLVHVICQIEPEIPEIPTPLSSPP
jgi:hypothetical protein